MNLITPTSTLRFWLSDDQESLIRHANNPHIASCMRDAFPHPYTPDAADRFLQGAVHDPLNLFFAIEVDGEAVGGIGIHYFDDVYQQTAEIGYWLSESYWGQGIISDAIRTIVPVAFASHNIIRIQAGVFSNNPASMRVLEKNGFYLEAVRKNAILKQGQTLDEHHYVLFREDLEISAQPSGKVL